MSGPLDRVAADLEQLPRRLVEDGATRFDQIARAAAARVVGSGGTMRIRQRGGRVLPVRLTTATRIHSAGSSVDADITGVPGGPWVWIEDGTRPHRVGRPGDVLGGPRFDHPVRGSVEHPGAHGQQAWSRAVDAFDREYVDFADQAVEEALGG